jgi:hypothetical protein
MGHRPDTYPLSPLAGKLFTERYVRGVDTSDRGRSGAVREVLRQILLAAGALTHAFGDALAAPRFAGLSSNTDIVVLTSLYHSGPQRPLDLSLDPPTRLG